MTMMTPMTTRPESQTGRKNLWRYVFFVNFQYLSVSIMITEPVTVKKAILTWVTLAYSCSSGAYLVVAVIVINETSTALNDWQSASLRTCHTIGETHGRTDRRTNGSKAISTWHAIRSKYVHLRPLLCLS